MSNSIFKFKNQLNGTAQIESLIRVLVKPGMNAKSNKRKYQCQAWEPNLQVVSWGLPESPPNVTGYCHCL